MQKLIKLLLVIAMMVCAQLVFAGDTQAPVYTESKPGITVKSEQPEFIIKLKSNPTTGYSWFLREYDKKFVTPVKHHYETSNKKLAGSPGYEYWLFKMNPAAFTKPQETKITMVYKRPWENEKNPDSVQFTVTTQ